MLFTAQVFHETRNSQFFHVVNNYTEFCQNRSRTMDCAGRFSCTSASTLFLCHWVYFHENRGCSTKIENISCTEFD